MVAQADGNDEAQIPVQEETPGTGQAEGTSPIPAQAERPSLIVYKARSGTPTFRISLYDRDLWVKNGILELESEPDFGLHNRLEAEGLERVPA